MEKWNRSYYDSNKEHIGKSFCKGSCGKNVGACALWLPSSTNLLGGVCSPETQEIWKCAKFGCRIHILFSLPQIPLERCHCRKDLLPLGENQNQAHGDRYHQAGNDRHRPQCVPRERHDSQVWDHGWGARERWASWHPAHSCLTRAPRSRTEFWRGQGIIQLK